MIALEVAGVVLLVWVLAGMAMVAMLNIAKHIVSMS